MFRLLGVNYLQMWIGICYIRNIVLCLKKHGFAYTVSLIVKGDNPGVKY